MSYDTYYEIPVSIILFVLAFLFGIFGYVIQNQENAHEYRMQSLTIEAACKKIENKKDK